MITDQGQRGRPSARNRIILAAALLTISGASTLFGFRAMLKFDETPGTFGAVPSPWPSSSAIKRAGSGMHMLVFLHPWCSCSFATLSELSRIPARRKPGGALPTIDILFYRPRNSGWAPGELWERARQLPGAQMHWDEGGREARRFGATTSGFALLYGSSGDLLFSGGVTGSRGHEGTNYGIERLMASLDSGKRTPETSFVFGCALRGDDR
jgi:hypothetical protein